VGEIYWKEEKKTSPQFPPNEMSKLFKFEYEYKVYFAIVNGKFYIQRSKRFRLNRLLIFDISQILNKKLCKIYVLIYGSETKLLIVICISVQVTKVYHFTSYFLSVSLA
jgi:hypothetical protein